MSSGNVTKYVEDTKLVYQGERQTSSLTDQCGLVVVSSIHLMCADKGSVAVAISYITDLAKVTKDAIQ